MSLASTASKYSVATSIVTIPATTWTLICSADPQRWHVLIQNANAANRSVTFSPVQLPIAGTAIGATGVLLDLAYRDSPPLVTGELWAYCDVATDVVVCLTRFLE